MTGRNHGASVRPRLLARARKAARTSRPRVAGLLLLAIGAATTLVGCERPPPDTPAWEQCEDDSSAGGVVLYEEFTAIASVSADPTFAATVSFSCWSEHSGYFEIERPDVIEGATLIGAGLPGECPDPDLGVAQLGGEIVMEFDWTCSDDGEVFEEGRIRATLPAGALLEIGDTAPMELEAISPAG